MMESGQGGIGRLIGEELGTRIARYDGRDAILYALAVGASHEDLDLVYERQLHVLPTFALTFGLWSVEALAELGTYDRSRWLHVGQELTLSRSLPPRGEIRSRAHVEAVWDKGSAALVVLHVTAEFFEARYTMFLPGLGDFGGERGDSSRWQPPTRPHDLEATAPTRVDQAALYRLTGDRHPVHIDPAAAQAAGFSGPILHGLATLGSVLLALAAAVERKPWEATHVAVRFAGPVVPGDRVDVLGWQDENQVVFTAAADGRDVLTAGSVAFSG